jgi:hypothetical protein
MEGFNSGIKGLIQLKGSERYVSWRMCMGHLQLPIYPFSKEYEEQKDINVFLGISSLIEEM